MSPGQTWRRNRPGWDSILLRLGTGCIKDGQAGTTMIRVRVSAVIPWLDWLAGTIAMTQDIIGVFFYPHRRRRPETCRQPAAGGWVAVVTSVLTNQYQLIS